MSAANTFLVQACYSGAAAAAMLSEPTDPSTQVRALVEAAQGRLLGYWCALGQYDAVFVVELPDTIRAAALSTALAASGRLTNLHTTPLLTTEQAIATMRDAARLAG